MLVDQDNANVLAVRRKLVKGRLDGRVVRLVVDDEKVLLSIGAGGYVLSLLVCLNINRVSRVEYRELTPMPASSSPVTESYPSQSFRSPCQQALSWSSHLIANDGKELPVLEVGRRRRHRCVGGTAVRAPLFGICRCGR